MAARYKRDNNMKTVITIALTLATIALPVTAQTLTDMTNNTLSPRQRHLVAVSSLEAKGDLENLAIAVDRALDDSVTVNELKEAFTQLYAYTGFPRSLNALGVLQQVIAQRAEEGKPVVEGADASPLPDSYDALRQGTDVQTALRGGEPLNYAFAPATDYYLKAHLFGDIFARDIFSYADRELVTVSALASIEGAGPQLKAHITGAVNLGLSVDHVRAIPAVLAERVGDREAYRARKAVAAVFEEDFAEMPPFDFASGEPNDAYAQYFIGDSWQATLATGGGRLPVKNITFAPGCRNNWHIHHGFNQILICVNGKGWYQEWGKPAQALRPGDVIDIPDGVKHWHGAAKDAWFQHITVHTPCENGTNEWLEPVSDEVYMQAGEE